MYLSSCLESSFRHLSMIYNMKFPGQNDILRFVKYQSQISLFKRTLVDLDLHCHSVVDEIIFPGVYVMYEASNSYPKRVVEKDNCGGGGAQIWANIVSRGLFNKKAGASTSMNNMSPLLSVPQWTVKDCFCICRLPRGRRSISLPCWKRGKRKKVTNLVNSRYFFYICILIIQITA